MDIVNFIILAIVAYLIVYRFLPALRNGLHDTLRDNTNRREEERIQRKKDENKLPDDY